MKRPSPCRRVVSGSATVLAGTAVALALVSLSTAYAQPALKELFLAGSAAFARGDYTAAEGEFSACRRALGDNPVVDFDLAMTYLRLEQLGRARVCLERARRLAPRDRATQEELRRLFARLDHPIPPSPSWLHALWEAGTGSLTYGEALALAAVAELLAAALLGAWLLSGRRRLGWAALAAGLLLALVWPPALAKVGEQLSGGRAVVVAESASVRGGPGEEFGELIRLTEGADVQLLARPRLRFGAGLALQVIPEDQGLWREVRTPAGVRGYVRRSLIDPI